MAINSSMPINASIFKILNKWSLKATGDGNEVKRALKKHITHYIALPHIPKQSGSSFCVLNLAPILKSKLLEMT